MNYEEYAKKLKQERSGDENKHTAWRRRVDRFVFVYRHKDCLEQQDVQYERIPIDDVQSSAKCEKCGMPMKVNQERYLS